MVCLDYDYDYDKYYLNETFKVVTVLQMDYFNYD